MKGKMSKSFFEAFEFEKSGKRERFRETAKKAVFGGKRTKLSVVGVISAVFVLSTGCSLDTDVENLFQPPKPGGEQANIYNALTDKTGNKIVPVNPKSGKVLSAFIVEDLDGDGGKEAVAFYKVSEDDTVRVNYLDSTDDNWHSVADFDTEGTSVERVAMMEMGKGKGVNVIVGCTAAEEDDKLFTVYSFDKDGMTPVFESEPYSVFDVCDLDGDGGKELLTVSAESAAKTASAAVYRPDDSGAYETSSVALSEMYNGCFEPVYSDTQSGGKYVFIDLGRSGNNVMTEVLSYGTDHKLVKTFSPDMDTSETLRSDKYLTMDADGDGKAEIPIPHLCRGYDEKSEDPAYFTSWYDPLSGKLQQVFESYVSITGGFVYRLPEEWSGKITAIKNSKDKTVTIIKGDAPEKGEEIFSLSRAAGEKRGAALSENGYSEIDIQGGKHLYVKINEKTTIEPVPDSESIKSNLYTLHSLL